MVGRGLARRTDPGKAAGWAGTGQGLSSRANQRPPALASGVLFVQISFQQLFLKVMKAYLDLGCPVPATKELALSLELENQSLIVTLPGDEATVRGFSAVSLAIVDEAAHRFGGVAFVQGDLAQHGVAAMNRISVRPVVRELRRERQEVARGLAGFAVFPGADVGSGSGLRGLADRVAALDGTLSLDSPSGRGTRLRARIPVESRGRRDTGG